LHTWTFDADRNRMKLAIELRLRGRVPEQVIPARVAHDLLHPDVEIVTVQNRAAVGFERKSPQRVERSSQKLAVRLRADGSGDIELERRQAARVDGVDRHVVLAGRLVDALHEELEVLPGEERVALFVRVVLARACIATLRIAEARQRRHGIAKLWRK